MQQAILNNSPKPKFDIFGKVNFQINVPYAKSNFTVLNSVITLALLYTNLVNVHKNICNKLILTSVIFLAQHASICAKFRCLIALRS